jgi:histidinol-phosphate aminotransferase
MTFNAVLENVKSYEAGKPIELVVREYGIEPKNIIKLASNENPYGVSKKVTEKISKIVNNMSVYPDDSMFELKEALAGKFNVKSDNVIIGSGSDQVIEFCVHAKANANSKVLMSKTTFAMYEIYARQTGAKILKTPSDHHEIDEFREIYQKEGADIIFLCLPNNPLGECLDADEVYEFLKEVDEDTLVVLDGAYQEYAKYKHADKEIVPKDAIKKFPNVIYLGTFSKAYGLGGMRVGYGIAKSEIIKTLYKLRPPFNITTLSLSAAIEALKDEEFVQMSVSKNFEEYDRYVEFCERKGLTHVDSYTNFIIINMGEYNSSKVANTLLTKGVIVRDLASYGVNGIRITIGTTEQNGRVFGILDKVLDEYQE